MAEYTSNLNLKKPAGNEYYSVDDFNDNMDIIDSALITIGTEYPETPVANQLFYKII